MPQVETGDRKNLHTFVTKAFSRFWRLTIFLTYFRKRLF
jgi:hypothetical protein